MSRYNFRFSFCPTEQTIEYYEHLDFEVLADGGFDLFGPMDMVIDMTIRVGEEGVEIYLIDEDFYFFNKEHKIRYACLLKALKKEILEKYKAKIESLKNAYEKINDVKPKDEIWFDQYGL